MSERRCETCRWWHSPIYRYRHQDRLCFFAFGPGVPAKWTAPTDTCDQWSEKEKRDDD